MTLRSHAQQRAARCRSFMWAGMLLVALSAVGRLVGGAHELNTAHVVCADHGELVDVAGAAADLAGSDERRGDAVSSEPDEVDGIAHDHCAIAATLAQPLSRVARSAVVVGLLEPQQPPPAPRDVSPLRDQDLVLSAAPKTSPPLA